MKTSILSCKNLSYTIGYKKIFKSISFEIFASEFTLLTGENGSGKSSLLKLILQSSKRKEFQWNDNFNSKNINPISYLGHENGLYSSLTLRENLNFFNRILKNPMPESDLNILLERLNLIKRLDDPISTFSEGMKKKSGIIRALLARPLLLLLDEPLNGLDVNSAEAFLNILKTDFKDSAILLVSHEIDKLSKLVKNRLHIYNGEINYV
ncbi:MAG TPA: ATP-binding cassette domain-containing protein [Leptospiraceae bacterium]|nr:ATP-binding cassette domain-containing protein [Leptospiraceae bacterium]HMW07486.1 ATP-binding cassette domain-containing protein [Leptospiraceae bacterium]HMX33100.1 ATP-binding cassette domain-containing protein [Leptospiraceae bacterium]HMY33120.1 ATP-binding cassette domain-containing protein [Leptospiraceae bacterium]HMZ64245.1 ATP-binding cassette domain-containing protein [Leptospiraceae bacterium]